jgi:hypothetical protein
MSSLEGFIHLHIFQVRVGTLLKTINTHIYRQIFFVLESNKMENNLNSAYLVTLEMTRVRIIFFCKKDPIQNISR